MIPTPEELDDYKTQAASAIKALKKRTARRVAPIVQSFVTKLGDIRITIEIDRDQFELVKEAAKASEKTPEQLIAEKFMEIIKEDDKQC